MKSSKISRFPFCFCFRFYLFFAFFFIFLHLFILTCFPFFGIFFLFLVFSSPFLFSVVRIDAKTGKNRRAEPIVKMTFLFCENLIFGSRWATGEE